MIITESKIILIHRILDELWTLIREVRSASSVNDLKSYLIYEVKIISTDTLGSFLKNKTDWL